MACPDLDYEAHFFDTLSDMSLSEVLGNVLILSTPDGRKMVFTADD
jgi:heat shock protein HslJ